jgi:NAD(P)-dependent dehydrogenase (short-subunit alcohol dehydrogenase family)
MSVQDLSGTTAIVTGASRGFGRATAVALYQAGAQVIGVAQHKADLDEVREQLGEAFVPMAADAADPDLPRQLMARYQPQTVVLNAGAAPHTAPIGEHTWETFSINWDVDVKQVFHFVKESLSAPLKPGSVVVSFSSGRSTAKRPMPRGTTSIWPISPARRCGHT